jgi:hypothetical protein
MSILADGTTVTFNDGAASAYVAVPDIISFNPPEGEIGEYDGTALTSTAGIMIKKPKSRMEPGTWDYTAFYSDAEYLRVVAARGVEKSHKITYPDTKIDTIPGFIKSVKRLEGQNQEPMKMSVTIQITNLVVRT